MAISWHDLVPMPLAARMVYERARGEGPPQAHLDERLNGLAYVLAKSGGVYALEEGRKLPRRLARQQVASGHFRHGGKELHFLDHRAPIRNIGVTAACIDKAVDALRAGEETN